jgi:(E)-4-hydroxy-3-methylbut-2-enyl-diphosphate synthase
LKQAKSNWKEPFMYVQNRLRPRRFPSREVQVGSLKLGGSQPIRIQSMTNTPTQDVQATLKQVRALAEAGSEIVRITAPGIEDAKILGKIAKQLKADGCNVPLCADIHFSPRAALEAALHVEKVRINPGNYSGRPGRDTGLISDDDFDAGRDEAQLAFRPLLHLLKEEGRALRIGVNHGSLSQRMVHRYGDTPTGMVESALEFIQFCEEENFHNIILSMKSSNVRVMIYAVREMVDRMHERDKRYPIHLGVTEAGGGIEGILKSAQGIGALLEDGIGDTLRVSLTDDPVMELGPAQQLAARYNTESKHRKLTYPECGLDYLEWSPRETRHVRDRSGRFLVGGNNILPVTLSAGAQDVPGISPMLDQLPEPESRILPNPPTSADCDSFPVISLMGTDLVHPRVARRIVPVEVIHDDVSSWQGIVAECDEILQFHIVTDDVPQINSLVKYIHDHFPANRTMLSIGGENLVQKLRLLDLVLRRTNCALPVDAWIPRAWTRDPIALASQLGALLADGLFQSLTIEGDVAMTGSRLFAFTVLQGAGARVFSTEYISCPGCGRTLFDLETTAQEIQAQTAHLKGLKIGIMGCVVNGPGEMADADFGYVGTGKGKIDLYVGQSVRHRNISESDAVEALIALIREEGKWIDP